MRQAVADLSAIVGVRAACDALGIARAGFEVAPDSPADPGERIARAARNWSTTLAVPVLS